MDGKDRCKTKKNRGIPLSFLNTVRDRASPLHTHNASFLLIAKLLFLTHVILLGHGPCFTHVQAEDSRPERHYSMYQSSLEITRAVSQLPTPPPLWTFEVSATFSWRTGFGNIPQQIQWSYKVAERAFIRKMKLWLIYMFLHLVTQHTSCNHIVLTFHKSHIRPVPLIWSTYT